MWLAEENLEHFFHSRIKLHAILAAESQRHRKRKHKFDAVPRSLSYPWMRNEAEASVEPFVHFAASLLAVRLQPHIE